MRVSVLSEKRIILETEQNFSTKQNLIPTDRSTVNLASPRSDEMLNNVKPHIQYSSCMQAQKFICKEHILKIYWLWLNIKFQTKLTEVPATSLS